MEQMQRLATIACVLLSALLLTTSPAFAQATLAEPGAVVPGYDTVPPEDPVPENQTTGAPTGPTIGMSNVPGTPNCSGVTCLTQAERDELNALCKKAGRKWDRYMLCRQMAALISEAP
nr:hypothetical protein [uncultured Dongia sp.]